MHGRVEILQRLNMRNGSNGNNARRVDLLMTPIVMCLYVVKVSRVLESGVVPVEAPHPEINIWIVVSDRADVAFEVTMVDWVEADDGGEEAYISLSKAISDEILLSVENLLQTIKGLE